MAVSSSYSCHIDEAPLRRPTSNMYKAEEDGHLPRTRVVGALHGRSEEASSGGVAGASMLQPHAPDACGLVRTSPCRQDMTV